MNVADLKIWVMGQISPDNVRQQIEDFILRTIVENQIIHLPSQRVFAEINRLEPSLVKRAYSNLVACGWLYTRQRAGTMVAMSEVTSAMYYPASPFTDLLPIALGTSSGVFPGKHHLIHNFQSIGSDRLGDYYFPRALNRYVRYHRSRYKEITQAEQMKELSGTMYKTSIRKYLNVHGGFQINEGCINISIGRKESLDKIFSILLNDGDGFINTAGQDIVLLKSIHFRNLIYHGMSILEEGFIENLEKYVRENPIKAIYINSQCSYPEGFHLHPENSSKLISLAKQYHFYIVEENDYYEFWYRKDYSFLPLAQHDHGGHVIYVGPLSQSSPYMYSTRFILASKQFISIMEAMPDPKDQRNIIKEQAIIDLINNGELWHHVKHIRNVKEKDMEALYWELDNYLGPWIKINKPDSGLCFWLTFPAQVDIQTAMKYLLAHEIDVPYNHLTQTAPSKVFHMRLSFATFNILEAQAAAKLLKKMFEDLGIPKLT